MVIIRKDDFVIEEPTAVVIGKFDGVHLGHQRLLDVVVSAKKLGYAPTVFTFNPSFEELFGTAKQQPILTIEDKERILESAGVEYLVEYPLSRETAAMEPESFVKDVLIGRMNMKFLAAGRDLSFGHKGKGDAALMEKLSVCYDFELVIIDKVCMDGEEISSTRVRIAIEDGNMQTVSRLLGRELLS